MPHGPLHFIFDKCANFSVINRQNKRKMENLPAKISSVSKLHTS